MRFKTAFHSVGQSGEGDDRCLALAYADRVVIVWQCTGGMLHVDAISETSLDVSFPAVALTPGGFPGGTNAATATVSLAGSCTGIHLTR